MKLAQILGYQIDITRHAALRSLHRHLDGAPLTAPSLTALLTIADRPGCDQTMLGRAMAGNRSYGMKIASMLEAQGLLTRGAGRDRRSKGLFLTAEGERLLADVLRRHRRAEAALAAHLTAGERETLVRLLAKVRRGIADEEAGRLPHPAPAGAVAETVLPTA